MIRLLKAALVALIGLQALFYGLQNIANIEGAHGAMVAVMSNTGHEIYPKTFFFAVSSPALAWAALGLVLVGEFGVGLFGLKGGWDLFAARGGSAEAFHAAKKAGVMTAGLALFVWFGLFMAFGAAFFQMWQTGPGSASMEGAFMYAMASAITMMFVCLTDD